jgi:hypothetical protein
MDMLTGVYKLTNKINGKIYIGSSLDIHMRWKQHRINPSSLIGRALKKYGVGGFGWEVIEETPLEFLLEREQYYLDKERPFGARGYNIAKVAGSTLGIPCSDSTKEKIAKAHQGKFIGDKSSKSKTITFLSPEGKLVIFPSINLGSRERGLHTSCMAEVARGRRRQYKGWTCPEAPEWKPMPRCNHVVIDPNGKSYHVTNIKDFCIKHKLNPPCMRQVLSGKGQKQYKGWRLKGVDVKTFVFSSPTGEKHTVFNIKTFAEDNNLNYSSMRALVCGNQKQHRGWVLLSKR